MLPELLKMIILLTCSDIFTGKFMKFSISLKFFFTGKYMKFSKSSKFLESKNNTGTFKKISYKSHWYLFSGSMFIQYLREGCFKDSLKRTHKGEKPFKCTKCVPEWALTCEERGIQLVVSKTRKSCFFLQNRLLLIYCSSVYEQFFQLHCCFYKASTAS